MKICVTGKGGSGKSLIAVLLARSLTEKGYRVLLVDADESNLGLQRMLGMNAEPKPLMEYLGGKRAIQQKMIAGFSRGTDEPKMEILPPQEIRVVDIPSEYIAKAGSIQVLRIGKIEQPLEGCACPMGALAREFLAKLVPGSRDVVITDHEAGLEHFGRGVESGVDAVLVIVEPSFESVLLAERITNLAAGLGIRVIVALNKMTPEAEESLRADLQERGISPAGSIGYDPAVFRACLKGQPLEGVLAEKDIAPLVEALGL